MNTLSGIFIGAGIGLMIAGLALMVWANFVVVEPPKPVVRDCQLTRSWQMSYPPKQLCEINGGLKLKA